MDTTYQQLFDDEARLAAEFEEMARDPEYHAWLDAQDAAGWPVRAEGGWACAS